MGETTQIRKVYRMEQWKRIVQECQSSGQSNKAYCQQHGISEKTYYYWQRKLRTVTAEGTRPEIVELKPPEQAEAMVYIRFRGVELMLPVETNIDAIAAILRSLQQL